MKKHVLVSLIVLALAGSASARNLYVPVAGVAPGARNTLFRTDLRLFNPSATEPITVTLHFLPQGLDGSNIPGRTVRLAPREMVLLDNVVTDFLGWPAPAIGAVRIDSDTAVDYPVIATSRTYTDSPNPSVSGTYGQFIPALDAGRAAERSVVLHVSHALQFRTNAGAMNPGNEAATVTPTLFGADGTPVAEGAAIPLPPKSMTLLSIAAMFGAQVPLENGYIRFVASRPVFTFASIVDNGTGDQFFVVGEDEAGAVKPLL